MRFFQTPVLIKRMNEKYLNFVSDFKRSADDLKPREKLAKFGVKSLHLWELVALVLRTGERHKGGYFEDIRQLSHRLLSEAGFKGLFTQKDVFDLQETFGIYKSHAELLVAISEIGRRLHGKYDAFDASEPSKVFKKFQFLQKAKQEQCHILHLDAEDKCIFQEMIAIGSKESVQVFPNDILRSAIWMGIQKIIIIHNHLGESNASMEDTLWTLSLSRRVWELHQIKIVDHVVIGTNDYFSFLEQGIL